MPDPRKRRAAIDAHIGGYTLPHFEDTDWEELEQMARLSLNDAARAAIQDAADRYTEESLLQHDGAARAGMVGQAAAGLDQNKKVLPLTTFKKTLHQLIVTWREMGLDPETARLLADFAAETKHRPKGTPDLEQMLVDLEVMAGHLDLFLDQVANGVRPIDGPSASKAPPAARMPKPLADPFTGLVRDLEAIITEAGGTVTAATMTESSKRVSTFVAFVMHVNDCFPNDVKQIHATDAAWSKAIARALRG